MARVFIVEDHDGLRELLQELIERTDRLELCGSCASAEAALSEMEQAQPELALIDVALPGKSGIELVRELRKRSPHVKSVVLSGHASSSYAESARAAGAKAYVVKSQVGELVAVLRQVLEGGSRFPEF